MTRERYVKKGGTTNIISSLEYLYISVTRFFILKIKGGVKMTRTVNAFVKNGPETLMRITTLLRKRGCNLEGLVYKVEDKESLSKLTLTVGVENDDLMNNVVLQIRRLQDVFEVTV